MNLNINQWIQEKMSTLEKDTPINLVLSGGGVKGVAHIALLEKIEEIGLPIHAISGSSSGALVAALYASGLSTYEILSFFKTTPLFRYTWLNPIKAGIFDSDKYESVIKKSVKVKFEDLSIPLHIAATNIEEGKAEYFHEGNLTRPLLASCAIPAVFSPVNIHGTLYSDGGVMDNFPIKPFENHTYPLIGSYVCKPGRRRKEDVNSILKVTNHANALLVYAANEHKFSQIDATVIFPLGEFTAFDTKEIDQIYAVAKTYLLNRA